MFIGSLIILQRHKDKSKFCFQHFNWTGLTSLNGCSQLRDGDCGRIIDLHAKDGKLRPIGMYVGEFKTKQDFSSVPVYQAIILQQALQDIQLDYPHYVEKFDIYKPLEPHPPTE